MWRALFASSVALAVASLAVSPPAAAQSSAFLSDEKLDECVETLGIQLIVLIAAGGNPAKNVTKIRAAVEARAAEIERALENIEGDYALAKELGDLSNYEATYLEAAINEYPALEAELNQLQREIPCWQHLEKVLRIANLRRPNPLPIIRKPGEPPQPVDPDPYGLGKIFQLSKTYFDERAAKVLQIKRRVAGNRRAILLDYSVTRRFAVRPINSGRTPTVVDDQPQKPYFTYIAGGVAAVFPEDRELSPFNQYIPGETGYAVSLEGGVRIPRVIGPLDVSLGLLLDYGSSPLKEVVNFGGGRGPISGTFEQFGIQPTLRVTAPIGELFELSGEVGAGVRYQHLKINGAASASGWPFTWHVGGDLMMKLPNLPGLRFGPEFKYTQTDRIDGLTITGAPFKVSSGDMRAGFKIIVIPGRFEPYKAGE
ncbi:MAG: hypothetical protein KDJ16_17585 [Hyphomicrobiales bacterium]|nr:hypothetical protein [Hyphomicrobiales bacterium]